MEDDERDLPPLTHTAEMRKLQEAAGAAVDAYLRSIVARQIELGHTDVVREEGEYVTVRHHMTDWIVVAQFQNPYQEETELEPIPMFGKARATTPATALGLAQILRDWWN